MRVAESWLREWVNPDLDSEALAHQLTMLGLEVDELSTLGEGLGGVIVGEVVSVDRHPDADKLTVCKVSMGKGKPVSVVCGAPNVVQGMKSPFAAPGTTLPNGLALKKTKIRGVVSNGMLCSAAELGIGDDADGILHLPDDAPAGTPLADYLGLPDIVIDLDLTPNRGDCFSILGIARDVAALTGAELTPPAFADVEAGVDDTVAVELVEPAGCPVFAGQVIRGIDPGARSPLWIIERLRRAGLREIHPVVDITNYVMLELGQPLHAYDLGLLQGGIRPRLARKGERVTLLDENEVEVNDDTLVITDDSGVIGLAGIMGGLGTAVSEKTTDVYFEGAFWPPEFMAGRARSYGMHTDASMRFERGVDPTGQGRAVQRATELLILIAGGTAGPLVVTRAEEHVPASPEIHLRRERLANVLGLEIDDTVVGKILERLQLKVDETGDGWDVTVPPHRFDLAIEADLIEEVARIHGYDAVPEITETSSTPLQAVTENRVDIDRVAELLVARGYRETITYSFVDANADRSIAGSESTLVLANPISSEMSTMRSSLWPGMLQAAATNLSRQQDRVRLFETGRTFHGTLEAHDEVMRVAGLVIGSRLPEQWGSMPQAIDFFDIKSDVSALLELSGKNRRIEFAAASHPALQPGQSAEIVRDGDVIGVIGKLHPRVAKAFDLKPAVYLFELDAGLALQSAPESAEPVSKFPAIRRDIAIIVDEDVLASDLVKAVENSSSSLIRSVRIFDVYTGPGIEAGRKSVAIGLILQETSRTLTDDDADAAQAAAVQKLQKDFAAELRD